jgi:glutathione S-transferase
MAMTLWFAPGTCARVTLIALETIGEPFDTKLIALMRGDHRSPQFLAVNATGKVPALMVEGTVITQNPAILTYLARRYPAAALLPSPESLQAEVAILSKLSWFSADLHPLVTRIRMPQVICSVPEAIPRVREQAAEAMRFQLTESERQLAERSWVLGDTWSVFDAYLYWVWFRITGGGFDPTPFPSLAAHALRMEQLPAVQRALAREAAAQVELEALGLAIPGSLRVTQA